MIKFKIGDVVTLASGGPDMTIVGSPDADQVRCMWFVKCDDSWTNCPYVTDFHREALVLERPVDGKS